MISCNMRTLYLMLVVMIAVPALAPAGDWPTYRHDNARSAVTSESLKTPLAECWVFSVSGQRLVGSPWSVVSSPGGRSPE